MSNVFSSRDQLLKISNILKGYLKLPFSGDSIPGSLMESVVGIVRGGEVLNTYDFVDVINREQKVGWQVKSTKSTTPVTWKRAKIPNSQSLIEASRQNVEGLQALGDSIIKFCNDHAIESFDAYSLDEIGFSRLIVHPDGKLTYFEKVLCTKQSPKIFNENDFEWKWSTPKVTKKKEQLPALHGTHKFSRRATKPRAVDETSGSNINYDLKMPLPLFFQAMAGQNYLAVLLAVYNFPRI